jgi:hypothetical protein
MGVDSTPLRGGQPTLSVYMGPKTLGAPGAPSFHKKRGAFGMTPLEAEIQTTTLLGFVIGTGYCLFQHTLFRIFIIAQPKKHRRAQLWSCTFIRATGPLGKFNFRD